MLQLVDVGVQAFGPYDEFVGEEVVQQVRDSARDLQGVRVLHLNATPYGGGVSELLRSLVPVLRDLGLAADWKVIVGDTPFFQVTKKMHNALQGADYDPPREDRESYLAQNQHNASLLEAEYDVIVVHDPQPLAIRHFRQEDRTRWVWRCHIDTSEPSAPAWEFLRSFVEGYDAMVFTMEEFVPPGLDRRKVHVIPPAIDPLSPKNMELPSRLCRSIVSWTGVEPDRPLITQVSRFDPWKDPVGVIAAYRRVRKEMPEVQLALLGGMALDDPEGWDMHSRITEETKGDLDIHVRTNLTGIGDTAVNAFQSRSDVVMQKSIREGFGLVVAETLWKGTPVVAHRAGGITLQMADGDGGYLADSDDEFVEKLLYLLEHPQVGQDLSSRGRERIRKRFLLPRMVLDELRLLRSLVRVGKQVPSEEQP
ncbi:MAG: glycosyltransferase [Dehalococcoidia bacterium]